jgi:iron complex transport system substrate-binding protein
LTAAIAVLTLLAPGGCGMDGRNTGSEFPGIKNIGFPVTLGALTLDRRPERIVSLVPTATEMLFAIGAGPQVVAADEDSVYPAAAPKTNLSGFEPDVAAIAARRPDLVVISDDVDGLVARLSQLKIPVLRTPMAMSLDDTYSQIGQLGTLTGHPFEAEILHRQMTARISRIVTGMRPRSRPMTYYYELDPTLYTVTSKTFIGSLLRMLGLISVADRADPRGIEGGYPKLTAAGLIRSNPDTIFLADTTCCRQTARTVAARPGWNTVSAVRTGRIYPLDDDLAATWGPRTVDLLQALADAVS